jgi:hypothetical protein
MRWPMVFFLIVVPAIGIANAQNSQVNPAEVAQLVQRRMDIEVGLEQMVPKGVSIEAKEVARKGSSGHGLIVQYHIFLKGVPPGTLFKALSWPPNVEKPYVTLEGISVGKDGILMCAGMQPEQCGDPRKPNDPIEFTVLPMKGEPSRFVFVSSDIRIGTVVVADPIEAKNKACTIKLLRLEKAFTLAFLSGIGFLPDTDVHYRVSAEKTNDFVIKADSNGRIRVAVVPYAGMKKQGSATLKITEAECSPEVKWDWGPI